VPANQEEKWLQGEHEFKRGERWWKKRYGKKSRRFIRMEWGSKGNNYVHDSRRQIWHTITILHRTWGGMCRRQILTMSSGSGSWVPRRRRGFPWKHCCAQNDDVATQRWDLDEVKMWEVPLSMG
jgi:hypothetical protein